MAVLTDLLGQQVRCPTCQGVVVAPDAAPAPPTTTATASDPQISFDQPRNEGHDSIFGEALDEDVFGSAPPKVEVPDAAAAVANSNFASYPPGVPQPSEAPPQGSAAVEPQQLASADAANSPSPLELEPAPAAANSEQTTSAEAAFANGLATEKAELPTEPWGSAQIPSEAPPEQAWAPSALEMGNVEPSQGALRRQAAAQESRRGSNLLLTILLPYSVVMTMAAGWYFYKSSHTSSVDHPFANIPDIVAQYEPAKRKQLTRRIEGMPAVDAPLPASLLVRLGESLRVGDMEVTPERIEQGRATVHTVTQDNQDSLTQLPGESLVLHLKVRNCSGDIYFCPTDPVFNRYYDRRSGSSKPYNQIVVGSEHYYGGPIDVLRLNGQRVKRQYISGQDNDDSPLPPGEERQTVICSDARDGSLDAVKNYKGSDPILWRVQLRRGLTSFRGQELSVCAVIGVQFNPDDVQKAKN
jgi:hypothetical protein